MGPKTKDLIQVLSELIALLEGEGESLWSEWMGKAKIRLEKSVFNQIA